MAAMTEGETLAVRIASADNVATLLAPAGANAAVTIRDGETGRTTGDHLIAREPLEMGHKVALAEIPAGAPVLKYGVPIGRSRTRIAAGQHVHVHNVESLLGTRQPSEDVTPRVRAAPPQQLRTRIAACLEVADVPEPAREAMSDALIEAHLRGVETHGIRRLAPYIRRLRAGGVDARATPRIDTNGTVLRVDGRNAIGHYVASLAADHVARTARANGTAVALVRNSNHFGFAGYYATRIAAMGCVALVTSNGQVMVGPEGATRPLFSNDPVAIACPLADGTCFELDMAMSVTSRAKLVQAAERNEPVAEGIALDPAGVPTTDAAQAAAGILLPFGGAKGFGLLAAIEMLTGVLGGGAYADMVASKEASETTEEGTSHFLLAVDLQHAGGAEAFTRRMQDLISRMEGLPLRSGSQSVRYPGKRRWRLRKERLAAGIPLSDTETEMLDRLCDELGVRR